ncbi:hypothetical protein UlMin_000024 [Ulmus minor]
MEKLEEIKWKSDDQSGSGQTRSYTCTFCKRGFSNAQALGGHMNIHRRDRARIIQFSEENQLSSEPNTTKNPVDDDPNPPPEEEKTTSFQLREVKQTKSVMGENHEQVAARFRGEEVQVQIPFLVEGSSTSDNPNQDEKKMEELDLELRLGPDRHQTSPSTLSTREFF